VRAFCARVKKAREELTDLTQDEMADAIGCGRSAYRHYEGGRMTKMPHYYIPAFLQKTGASEKWLMRGEGPMKAEIVPMTETAAELMERINTMAEEEQKHWLGVIDFAKGRK
jgi:hypothetical protein